MKHHPEQFENEIYMGNTTMDGILRSSWKTSRCGKVALGRDGQPVGHYTEDFKPWFIQVAEVEAVIEMERITPKLWSEGYIKTLQPMVDARTIFVEMSSESADKPHGTPMVPDSTNQLTQCQKPL